MYQLESTVTGKRVAVRTATLDREHPELPSVCDIWKAADFLEREVFDFYGVVFIGHPDMRRLYLRNDWVGYPMRKDDDPEAQNPLRMDNEETIDTTTELELNPDGTVKNKESQLFGDDEYVVNIGPQHPATHGVMRFRVSLEGEIIEKIDANCGYIHRGIEKMCESLTYPQTLALTDRLDYLALTRTATPVYVYRKGHGHRGKRARAIHPHHHGRVAAYRFSPAFLLLSSNGPRCADRFLLRLP